MLTYRSETDEEAADGAEKQVQAVAGRWRERNVDAQNNISNSDGSKLEDAMMFGGHRKADLRWHGTAKSRVSGRKFAT